MGRGDVKTVQDTQANNLALAALIERANGGAFPGVPVGAWNRANLMPATWDGTGSTPPGWTRPCGYVWVQNPGITWCQVDDADVASCAASANLNATEKSAVAAAAIARIDKTDFSSLTPQLPAIASVAQASKAQVA